MPGSTDRALDGRFRVACRAAAAVSDEALQELDGLLQRFVDAIDVGLLHPARLAEAPVPTAGEERQQRMREFAAAGLAPGAFRVLNGMFAHFDMLVAPLAAAEAYMEGSRVNLLRVAADYPARPQRLPFALHLASPMGVAPSALVRIAFAAPPPEEERAAYLHPFAIWNRLVDGGYPVPDGAPGESGVGATETSFVAPAVVEHAIESHAADPRCFDLLVNLAVTWAARRPIRAVHIE